MEFDENTSSFRSTRTQISKQHKKLLTNFGKTIENSIPRFGCMVFVAMNDKYFRFGVEFSYFYMYITFSLFIYFMVGTISLAAAIK